MGGKSVKIEKADKQAQLRLKNSKFKGKVLQFLNLYGHYTSTKLQKWADDNVADEYSSVIYTSYAYPVYKKNKQGWIEGLENAYKKDWRVVIIQFTDAQFGNNTETVTCIYKFPFVKDGEEKEIYFELKATFDTTTGKWKKSTYEQYGSKYPLKYNDYVAPTTSSRSYTEPSYTEPYKSSSTTDNSHKQYMERQERDRKEREQREYNDRISRENYARQQRQAAEREARYQEQQRQFRENMRRQEQAQADYRRQQQQQAQQRYREAQQRLINTRRY